MNAAIPNIPKPINEPVRPYAPGDADREAVKQALDHAAGEVVEIPCIINGERVFTGNVVEQTMPCDHQHVLAKVHLAGPEEVERAATAAESARQAWAELDYADRASIYLKAADLLAGPHRAKVNASCMLGQAKTVHQAEIDAACELIDFWRFNAAYLDAVYAEQPPENSPGVWNRLDHRPLDGFVFAVTPFNFTAIGLNLPTAPTMVGNTVVWKPSLTASLSNFRAFEVLEEAGLPPGVINLVHGHGADVGDPILARPELAGLHFTGSTATFQHLWRSIGNNIAQYRQYPRIVGETGGKDFIVAHPSADPAAVATAILRGAFEYQGQKCSAASRMYLPKSLWADIRERVTAELPTMKMGDVRDFSNFLAAVIDQRAFEKHQRYLEIGKQTAETVAGGEADGAKGWFVQPTLFRVDDPKHQLMREEIFGPIATVYIFEDAQWDATLDLVDSTSPYALTGAVFARDRYAVDAAAKRLRFSAGNFYINDKPTGAVVGQQPFGGSRASGTNDKAGSLLNLLRWTSPRAIKENFRSPTDWRYPFLGTP
ncbi:MAG: L-glutamate gamma-semialdehyde dehydrogenase [Myxococcota bacterium]